MNFQAITGIDIGHHSIRSVTLKRYKSRTLLISYSERTRGASIVADNQVQDHQGIVNRIKGRIKDCLFMDKKGVIALPENEVVFKTVHLPPLVKEIDYEFLLLQKVAEQISQPVNELVIDYVAESNSDNSKLSMTSNPQSMQSFQVIATKKSTVQSYTQQLELVGLKPWVMSVESHVYFYLLQQLAKSPPMGKLEPGFRSGILMIQPDKVTLAIASQNGESVYKTFDCQQTTYLSNHQLSQQQQLNHYQQDIQQWLYTQLAQLKLINTLLPQHIWLSGELASGFFQNIVGVCENSIRQEDDPQGDFMSKDFDLKLMNKLMQFFEDAFESEFDLNWSLLTAEHLVEQPVTNESTSQMPLRFIFALGVALKGLSWKELST